MLKNNDPKVRVTFKSAGFSPMKTGRVRDYVVDISVRFLPIDRNMDNMIDDARNIVETALARKFWNKPEELEYSVSFSSS
jgi:hypothetical protein